MMISWDNAIGMMTLHDSAKSDSFKSILLNLVPNGPKKLSRPPESIRTNLIEFALK